MSMDNYNGDIIAQRKAEVRKYARVSLVTIVVAVASLIAGAVMSNNFLLFIVPLIAVAVCGVGYFKIRAIASHKDEW
ncbi:hypothetical protein F7230_08815 [Corynebacterium sp. 320]|uniref:hypothetical protein n=1 Tax=Corynebacterium TaxID=1716 RepID=UPI00125CC740|nr:MULTISPECIES: hypothetical protein [Corynebacterium]KAB1502521.1 hypothetical protein F7230_08815 [Corynebacterium sp. 320]KAB1551258.1 hypothetical protein F7233_06965 [Corynebacterium sp. 321]KAB1551914.1 hypothetical protein F7232_07305 [Corynebacterium sp. 319]KAB3526128.1 hypothetical protein F8354_08815 [Corynebacterium sp. 250]KAB3538908.1 hypothetical protein F8390_07885 [Corynebacterium sp. 366]